MKRNCTASGLELDTDMVIDRSGITGIPEMAPAAGEEASEKKSTATALVEMAMSNYTFGTTSTGDAFAVPNTGPRIVSMLRGSKMSLRAHLAKAFFTETRRAAPQNALADALTTIEGFAQEEDESKLYMRVARVDDVTWVDLGDATGLAISIDSEGWAIKEPPVLFKRTTLNSPLPHPTPGGSLDNLWALLNVIKADKPLILAWLIAALFHDIPHPILALFGEQGTGKSTALKRVVSCLDPSPVPLRKPPKSTDAWVSAAAGSWMVGIDNLSHIPDELSDSLCRASTGDGDVRRKLYTDGDHAVFAFRRCVIINGIDVGSLRGDLAERLLPIHLELIPETGRREEREMDAQWEACHPRILGELFTLAARVSHALPSVELESKPRMADFARILAAVDKVLNTNGFSAYLDKQNDIAADSLAGDPLMAALVSVIDRRWQGSSRDLFFKLTPDRPPKGWPSSSRQVTARLKRNAPSLRKLGWVVAHDDGRNKAKIITWQITPPREKVKSSLLDPPSDLHPPNDHQERRQETPSPSSPPSPNGQKSHFGGDQAGVNSVGGCNGDGFASPLDRGAGGTRI